MQVPPWWSRCCRDAAPRLCVQPRLSSVRRGVEAPERRSPNKRCRPLLAPLGQRCDEPGEPCFPCWTRPRAVACSHRRGCPELQRTRAGQSHHSHPAAVPHLQRPLLWLSHLPSRRTCWLHTSTSPPLQRMPTETTWVSAALEPRCRPQARPVAGTAKIPRRPTSPLARPRRRAAWPAPLPAASPWPPRRPSLVRPLLLALEPRPRPSSPGSSP
mmetsp:Transcript_15744/g.42130  ORF Transcript_15744/g.42130 Transcript_15744/m.42130 type:complete len:214 (+) Transcript_15744:419-1060(+)